MTMAMAMAMAGLRSWTYHHGQMHCFVMGKLSLIFCVACEANHEHGHGHGHGHGRAPKFEHGHGHGHGRAPKFGCIPLEGGNYLQLFAAPLSHNHDHGHGHGHGHGRPASAVGPVIMDKSIPL